MNKIFIVIIFLVVIAVAIGAYFLSVPKKGPVNNNLPAQEAAPTAQATEVVIKNFAFNPAELQVKVGTEVKWINQDSMNHTIANTDFQSGELGNGQTYSHVFTAVDIYDYHCSIHPSMAGKVIVIP
jgi:plastocyanin